MEELLEFLERKHEKEKEELKKETALLLKSAKKSNRSQIEAKTIQMEYDLRAKQMAELEELEDTGVLSESLRLEMANQQIEQTEENHEREQEVEHQHHSSKKEKALKKKEKKEAKKSEKEREKQLIAEDAALTPSDREIELQKLNSSLQSEGLEVSEIEADGHCLYRSIADQLKLVQSHPSYSNLPLDWQHLSFVEIRQLAANQMRSFPDSYAPFLGLEGESSEYQRYCDQVESCIQAEWGGYVEVGAICTALEVTIWIYEADKPVVRMGQEFHTTPPLRIAFHRHYYTLGEHYNSIQMI